MVDNEVPVVPESVPESRGSLVVSLLVDCKGEGEVLAGGMGLAEPLVLADLGCVPVRRRNWLG